MAAKFRAPSAAVEAGRARRVTAAAERQVRMEWFLNNVLQTVNVSMRNRVRMATQYLHSRITQNLSTPVVKGTGPRGGRVVAGRSREGEYPHAETTQLLKTLLQDLQETWPGTWDGFVGTPLDYGLQLETRMNRSFLKRIFDEQQVTLRAFLTGPVAA